MSPLLLSPCGNTVIRTPWGWWVEAKGTEMDAGTASGWRPWEVLLVG